MATNKICKNMGDERVCGTRIKQYFSITSIDEECTCYNCWSSLSLFLSEGKHSSSVNNLVLLRRFVQLLAVTGSMAHLSTVEAFVAAPPAFLARMLTATSWTGCKSLRSGLCSKLSSPPNLLVLMMRGWC